MNYTLIIWLCWGAFGLLWIGGAIYNAFWGPKIVQKNFQLWRYWLIGALLMYLISRHLIPRSVWIPFHLNIPWLQLLGVIILIACTLFTLWARIILGVMWSSSVTLKSDHELRTNGPYRITRHPIYSGMLGMLVGTNLTTGVLFLPISLFALGILLVKIRNEEKLMVETFGEQYLEYRKRVPQLIPGLKR